MVLVLLSEIDVAEEKAIDVNQKRGIKCKTPIIAERMKYRIVIQSGELQSSKKYLGCSVVKDSFEAMSGREELQKSGQVAGQDNLYQWMEVSEYEGILLDERRGCGAKS